MSTIFKRVWAPATLSFLLVLPLMSLEWINRQGEPEAFPVPLFGFLWLLGIVFFLLLRPILQQVRAGKSSKGRRAHLILQVVLLGAITWCWVVLVIDQLPCFLGVANCD